MCLFLPDTLGNYTPCHTFNFSLPSGANLPILEKSKWPPVSQMYIPGGTYSASF